MADNTTLDAGSGGDVIATDDISGVKFQRVKLVHGADGVNDGDVSSVNGLPVEGLAGEEHIGEVGGNTAIIQATPTMDDDPDYSTGDVFGAKMTLAAMRVSGGSGILHAITLKSEDTLAANDVDVLIFSSDPSSTTFTDNGALALADADLGKLLGAVSLDTLVSVDSASVLLQATNIGLPVYANGSANLYAVMVARATIALAVTDGVTIDFHFLRD